MQGFCSWFVVAVLATAAFACQEGAEGDRCNPLRSTDECNSGLSCTTPPSCVISVCCPAGPEFSDPQCACFLHPGAACVCDVDAPYDAAAVLGGPDEAPVHRATELLLAASATLLLAPRVAHADEPGSAVKPAEPFAFGDFTWLNGDNRQHKAILDTPYFTPELLVDVNFTESLAHPIDDTVVGSTALSRNDEITLAFVGIGGDFHYDNARGRLMTQFGTRSTLVPRNDESTDRGQFDLQTALRYVSEAYGGYHWDVLHGINLDVGIFMSYVGLFSYDNFENWMYLPSYTSDDTPWFFDGVRLQIFPTEKLKIEPWLINGWQSYGKFNELPGFGAQILYRPAESVSMLTNDYVGWDTEDTPNRVRFHSDNSLEVRTYSNPNAHVMTKQAFSITADFGFEDGAGVVPFGGKSYSTRTSPALFSCTAASPCDQRFLSWMAYYRVWFWDGMLAWTAGGGMMDNPGRYLVLAPTGNATPTGIQQPFGMPAASDPFPITPGAPFDAYDYETGVQFMPVEQETWDLEWNHRQASVPYFAGHGGVTSPDGYWTTATPRGWTPDLIKGDWRVILAFLLRF